MLLYLLTKSLSIYIHIDTYYIYILKEDIYILLKLKNYFYHDYINNEYEYYETRSCIPRRSMHSVPIPTRRWLRGCSRARHIFPLLFQIGREICTYPGERLRAHAFLRNENAERLRLCNVRIRVYAGENETERKRTKETMVILFLRMILRYSWVNYV